MDITKQVNSITNKWKKASLLNSLYNGCFVALDSDTTAGYPNWVVVNQYASNKTVDGSWNKKTHY